MTYRNFYSKKLDVHILKDLDSKHKRNMKLLIEKIDQGSWTKKQHFIQCSTVQNTYRSWDSKRTIL